MDDRPNAGFNNLFPALTCCFTDKVMLKITFKTEWRNVSTMDFAVYTTFTVGMNIFLGYETFCQLVHMQLYAVEPGHVMGLIGRQLRGVGGLLPAATVQCWLQWAVS